ncbi:MAG: cobalamin adenosyltransferase [Thermocladium sp.]
MKLPLFVDCVESGDTIACPGDTGYSTIPLFGKTVRLRKDSQPIQLMGCLDELSNLAHGFRLQGDALVARVSSIVVGLAVQLNAYMVQGSDERLGKVITVEKALESLVAENCRGREARLGWIMPTTQRGVAVDSLRVKLRQCGRIASSMVEEYGEKAANVMMILNQADKIAAQLLYCMGEGKVFKTVDDLTAQLLREAL